MDRQGISSPVFDNNDGANNYITKMSIFGLQHEMQGAQSTLQERLNNLAIDIRHSEARKRDYIDTKLGELKDQLCDMVADYKSSSLHHPQGGGEQVDHLRSADMMQVQIVLVYIYMAITITFVINIAMKGKSSPSIMCTTTTNDIYYELKCDNDIIIMKMLHKRKCTNPNMRHGPNHPQLGTILIIGNGNIVTLRVFVELPLELTRVSWSGIIGPCIWCNSNL